MAAKTPATGLVIRATTADCPAYVGNDGGSPDAPVANAGNAPVSVANSDRHCVCVLAITSTSGAGLAEQAQFCRQSWRVTTNQRWHNHADQSK